MENLLWHSKKPKFKEDCILITADWHGWGSNHHWEYKLFEIKWFEAGEGCYWSISQDGEEWGDIADLRADYYSVISPRKPLSAKQTKVLNSRNV